MACCAALTLLFSWLYRAVGWIIPGRDDAFAPAASWPPAAPERPVPDAAAKAMRVPQELIGQALVVVGIAWFVAGVLAMHLFGLLEIRSAPVDLAFHSSGLLLAVVGLGVRFQPHRTVGSPA